MATAAFITDLENLPITDEDGNRVIALAQIEQACECVGIAFHVVLDERFVAKFEILTKLRRVRARSSSEQF